jgi:Fic family protein
MKNKKALVNPMFIIQKPDFKKVVASKLTKVFETDIALYRKIVSSANYPKYIYWDKFKYKSLSKKLNVEEQWLLVRNHRDAIAIETPIKSEEGKYFKWVRLPSVDEKLHDIDMLVGGQLFPKSKIPVENREVYINRGVIEEAIASSQLEGAHTTRAAAKKLILERKKPKNKSEQMIINNYKAMLALEDDFKERKLSRSLLFELHSMLTDGTIDESEQKRFRKNSDQIVIEGSIGSNIYTAHVPPDDSFLQVEIDRLIDYANDELNNKFVHPIIKAIFIHFWIGYLHPFTDGNGRMARSLFYWYLLKSGYWAFTYLPISTIIKKSPMQYAMAYIYTEQDSDDLTYFFDYQMRKISQAIGDFNEYIYKQVGQNKKVSKIINNKMSLNERQKQLIFYFISEDRASTTTTSHSIINNISRQTATKDLKDLELLGLIKPKREGKYIRYYETTKLKELVKLSK